MLAAELLASSAALAVDPLETLARLALALLESFAAPLAVARIVVAAVAMVRESASSLVARLHFGRRVRASAGQLVCLSFFLAVGGPVDALVGGIAGRWICWSAGLLVGGSAGRWVCWPASLSGGVA